MVKNCQRLFLAGLLLTAPVLAFSKDCPKCDSKKGGELLACEKERASCEAQKLAEKVITDGAAPGKVNTPKIKIPKRW